MKKLTSVLTDDMDICYLTGKTPVERHHVFGGANRKRSEKYGYIVPLYPEYHTNGVHFKDNGMTAKEIDYLLKCKCQKHFEKNHGSRSDFISEFGKNYL